MLRRIIAFWAIASVVVFLLNAVYRLVPYTIESLEGGLTAWQWTVMSVWVVLNAHAEGYRGFHRRFSPRVVARALHLAKNPTPLRVVLAPFYCMSYFGASRRGMIVSRCVTAGIVAIVIVVRQVSQPWRGIIDAGVVVGLSIGVLSLLYFAGRAAGGRPADFDPDLPENEK